MSDFSINIVPDSQTFINVIDDGQTVTINPLSFVDGLTINYISGDGSGELDHNTLLGLQGGSDNYFYHLNSGQYFNLATGSVIRPNETGAFYAASNPSGFITGINNLVFTTGDQIVSGIKTFSNNLIVANSGFFGKGLSISGNGDLFDTALNINGSINIDGTILAKDFLMSEPGGSFSIASDMFNPIYNIISIFDQGIEINAFDTKTEILGPVMMFGKLTGTTGVFQNSLTAPNLVYNTNNQTISGIKTFTSRPIVNTTGILLSGEATTTSYVTGISGSLQTQITSLNNQTGDYALKTETGLFITSSQTGMFYPTSNPSGFITGSTNSFTITNVTTNSNKLALTNIQNGHVVKITEESNRIEQYLSGSINSNDNWIVLKNTINLFINNRSNTQVNVNGITCPSFVTTNVGWVDPISQITFLPQQSFIVDGISKYGSSNVYYEAGYNYASLAYDILNDGTVTITKKLPDRFSGVLFISNF